LARKIVESILKGLRQSFAETLHEAVMDMVGGIMRGFLRRLAMALLGTLLVVFGVALLCIGLVRFLAIFLQEWLAWIVVGLLIAVLGVAVLLTLMPRRRH